MQHELIFRFNSRKFLTLSILLVCIILASACQKQNATSFNANSNLTEAKIIPKDWKKIETDFCLFFIPPTMKNKNVRGIDTEVLQYEDEDLTLTIQRGALLGDLNKSGDFFEQHYESKKTVMSINGEEVIILNLDLNKPKLENWATDINGSTSFERVKKNNLVNVSFPDRQTVFSIESSTIEEQETAKTILHSIKFNKK